MQFASKIAFLTVRSNLKMSKSNGSNNTIMRIPAQGAKAVLVKKGAKVKVINTYGSQVVDCWAFNAKNVGEFMSMEHTRISILRYRPNTGDKIVTNKRRPILRIIEDTCNIHDTMIAACNTERYKQLGCEGYHANCEDNLWLEMTKLHYQLTQTPCPFNLWQNTPVEADGSIGQYPAAANKGDYILMRAEMDLVICLSACPMDVTPINGLKPKGAQFEIC